MKSALFFFIVLVLVFSGVFVSGMLAEFCSVGLLGFAAITISWFRFVPLPVRMFITYGPVMVVVDIALWYLGWTVLPDSTTAKGAFVVMHILFSFFLLFEAKRMRKTLFKGVNKQWSL